MNNTLQLFSFYFDKPCKYISFKEYNSAKHVILGHFTTSVFLNSILENGIQLSQYTGNSSYKEIFKEDDENYIYLAGHFDRDFSKNAVKKFGGNEILILVKVKRDTLELDDVNNIYSKKGIKLNSNKDIYNALTQSLFSQCRTKQIILPEQIIGILDIEKIEPRKLAIEEYYKNAKLLTLEELQKKIDDNLLK